MKRFSKIELFLFALAWLVALAVVARGAEPRLIEAPDKIAPYKLVDVRLTGTWESAIFTVEPETAVDQRTSTDGKLLTFVAPPGTYTVRCVAVNFSEKKLAQAKAVVVIGEAGPTPTPTPQPQPSPTPTPTPTPSKPVAVYLVYESGDLTPATARVRDALAWKKTAEAAGIRWLAFDKDQGAKRFPEATKRAIAAGLPAVVFLDAQGVPEVMKAPGTAEAMDSLVKGKAGK